MKEEKELQCRPLVIDCVLAEDTVVEQQIYRGSVQLGGG